MDCGLRVSHLWVGDASLRSVSKAKCAGSSLRLGMTTKNCKGKGKGNSSGNSKSNSKGKGEIQGSLHCDFAALRLRSR